MYSLATAGGVPGTETEMALHGYTPKIVYVLSGGTPRCLCHLGMLEALEKRGVKPDLVVGTSAGALIGALYSHFGSAKDVLNRIARVAASEEFDLFRLKYFEGNRPLEGHVQRGVKYYFSVLSESLKSARGGVSFNASAMIAERDLAALYGRIFDGISFETLKIPFAAMAVDLSDGVPVMLSSRKTCSEGGLWRAVSGGDALAKSVMASSAIPFLFPTVRLGGHHLADGGMLSNLPVYETRAVLRGRPVVIAGFDVTATSLQSEGAVSALEQALRLMDPVTRSVRPADQPDILFKPTGMGLSWKNIRDYQACVQFGRTYMTRCLLDGFERVYEEKCLAIVQNDRNRLRRFVAATRLRQFLPQA